MMYMFIMTLMIMNTILFTQMVHPMSMGMMLLLQTLFICLMTGLLKSFWFSYILFLIFIGGMLILFIYMSSLSSNEKMKFSMNNFKLLMMFFMSLTMLLFTDKFYIMMKSMNNDLMMMNKNLLMKENFLITSKIYDMPNSFITILMIIYLLLTLIVVVKITNSFMGPLRTKN